MIPRRAPSFTRSPGMMRASPSYLILGLREPARSSTTERDA
jgi:hypothetical protein